MKEGKCPKCGSIEIFREIPNAFRSGEYIPHLEAFEDYALTIYSIVPYVCVKCGYLEFHLDEKSLNKIPVLIHDKEFWQKVG